MRRAVQIMVGIAVLIAGWWVARRFMRRRGDEYEYSYAERSQSYGLASTPQPAVSASAPPGAASGTVQQNPPLATDKPSEEPAESLSAPIGTIAQPPQGATDADGTLAQAGDDYMPGEAVPPQAGDQVSAVSADESEQPGTTSVNTAQGEPAAEPAPDTASPPDEPPAPDDLLVIEGIGPKISTIVVAAGITSFAELAAADVAKLEAILRDAGIHTSNPATWPQQARLAADGQWDDLRELQERIKNGRIEE